MKSSPESRNHAFAAPAGVWTEDGKLPQAERFDGDHLPCAPGPHLGRVSLNMGGGGRLVFLGYIAKAGDVAAQAPARGAGRANTGRGFARQDASFNCAESAQAQHRLFRQHQLLRLLLHGVLSLVAGDPSLGPSILTH